MSQECLICFDPIIGVLWEPPNKCKCKPKMHKECWNQWSKIEGPRHQPRCIICREDPLLALAVYRPEPGPRFREGQGPREQQMYGFMPRMQYGVHREIEDIERPRDHHRPCLRTFCLFIFTVMIYSIIKTMLRHLGAHHLVNLPDPTPFRFRDEL
jgi:hypothetical protein